VPVIRVRDIARLSDYQYSYATNIGNERNKIGASQNRLAKRDDAMMHIKGVRGEVAFAVLCGLPIDVVKCLDTYSLESDFVCTQPHVEVKNGCPISGKHNHNRGALHVVFRQVDVEGRALQITHMAYGWQCNKEALWLPWAGDKNWEIPNALQEVDILLKDYAKEWIDPGEQCA
jgi:hypothetical protein